MPGGGSLTVAPNDATALAAWGQRGPAANPQQLNRYTYVSNNPIKNTDSTGHLDGDDGTSKPLDMPGGGTTVTTVTTTAMSNPVVREAIVSGIGNGITSAITNLPVLGKQGIKEYAGRVAISVIEGVVAGAVSVPVPPSLTLLASIAGGSLTHAALNGFEPQESAIGIRDNTLSIIVPGGLVAPGASAGTQVLGSVMGNLAAAGIVEVGRIVSQGGRLQPAKPLERIIGVPEYVRNR